MGAALAGSFLAKVSPRNVETDLAGFGIKGASEGTTTELMSDETEVLVRQGSLYREYEAVREEILKHKWIESEKAGRDIGFERALVDWILNHRSQWRKSRQADAILRVKSPVLCGAILAQNSAVADSSSQRVSAAA